MEMNVAVENFEVIRVTLTGRLDVQGVGEIEPRFKASTMGRGQPVIVDLSGVSFITSMGMRLLLHTARELKHMGMKIVLLKPQPFVEEALKAAYLDEVFAIVHEEQQAYAIIWGQGRGE